MEENSLIKDIGRSYIISSLLPSAFFISVGYLLYKDFLPLDLAADVVKDPISAGQWVLLFTVIFWSAFALYSSVHWTVKFYEGYYFPGWLTQQLNDLFIFPRYMRQFKNIHTFNQLRDQRLPIRKLSVEQRRTVRNANADYSNLELITPFQKEQLLPTILGNVLRASEIYPEERFGMKGLIFWPRLFTSLPTPMMNQLEEKNNALIFLLNSSLLSYLNGILAFTIWLGSSVLQKWPGLLSYLNDMGIRKLIMNGFVFFTATEYLVLGISWIVGGYVLYRLAIPVAETYGLLVRSSFDLYRFDMLKQLNHPMPRTLKQERKLWAKLSEFTVSAGQLQLKTIPININYKFRKELLNQPQRRSTRKSKV